MGKINEIWILICISLTFSSCVVSEIGNLGSARVVFQTNYGDIEFGFFPTVAPKTVEHIFKLVRLGGYNTNHFFRVDRAFVAQVADVANGRSAPMNEEQKRVADKTIIGEFSDVKHVRGILSMGRYSDPNSAQSSFSILLDDAPHLDHEYAIFGKVTKGDETLKRLEELPTRREGIFVMPKERITILSSYYYDTEIEACEMEKIVLKRRLAASAIEVERQDEMLPVSKSGTARGYVIVAGETSLVSTSEVEDSNSSNVEFQLSLMLQSHIRRCNSLFRSL